ncbi:transglutaminase-like domain-containing protein [Geomesophilobacter sediminis]|uniref:Transglutaminase domain-containing protein n=1 Tax=Geomesophilobacter sediminis TaxID=2798584 RepID=A0A8J7LVB4_9BACT|nr:transglutaminase-like domain-containing protein [Geomesophilobacter sediminis]MBJ6724780.1 transglutaminase domain-containing protein [Geomesophilobacter sediminis]
MRALRLVIALAALLAVGIPTAGAVTIPKLTAPPLGERWFSIVVGSERAGFAHQSIAREKDGYRILSDGSVKMKVMGVSRDSASKESYLVGPDLSLKSFAVEQYLEGAPMQVTGEWTPKGIKTSSESGGKKKDRTIRAKGAVYPPQALNIFPLLHDPAKGKKYRVQMLDTEELKVKTIKIEVIGAETLPPDIPAIHLQNNLFPVVDNDIWVDLKGNTIKESVRDDLVLTVAEDEKTAQTYIANTALAKSDLIINYSAVRTEPIAHPETLKKLVLELTGIPAGFTLPEGAQQAAERSGDAVRFTMARPTGAAAPPAPRPADTAATAGIPSDAPQVVTQQKAIVADTKEPVEAARMLVDWVAKEIKGSNGDGLAALEALKDKKGSAPAQARLYTALARSAGIPTRFVSGIVYFPKQGFLFHSWAESYLGGSWVPVDPALGQDPADLTHIKLVEGETQDDLVRLAGVIGKLKGKVVEQAY